MKKFQMNIFCSILTLSLCGATLARPKEFRKLVRSGSEFVPNENKIMSVGGEPTCEELRAMWRFSRRQSRAAEITNEIPTYRDPFAYNVWEHYPKVRSVLGTLRSPARPWSRPIYGRIVQHAPSNHPRVIAPETRAYDEVLRYVDNAKPEEEPRRRPQAPTYRLSGGQAPANRLSRTGSFQHLKELIWAERAKELHQQRLLEEAAAKSAAEKGAQQYNDNSKGQSSNYKYLDQESKAARLRLLNGDDMEAAYAPDMYIRPYRQRSLSAALKDIHKGFLSVAAVKWKPTNLQCRWNWMGVVVIRGDPNRKKAQKNGINTVLTAITKTVAESRSRKSDSDWKILQQSH